MRTETWNGLTVRIAGGGDGNGSGEGPVIVLLHGFGAPGDDLAALWRVIAAPRGTRWVFPEGPLELDLGGMFGRAWWMVDFERRQRAMDSGRSHDLVAEVPDGMIAARARLDALLDELPERLGVAPARTIVGGFSQGAMLSCDVVLQRASRYAGLAMLSGSFVAADSWRAAMPARAGLPVFMSHGRQDALLPFATAELLRDEMKRAGLAVEWLAFRGGHEIPPAVLDGLGAWVQRVLGEMPPA